MAQIPAEEDEKGNGNLFSSLPVVDFDKEPSDMSAPESIKESCHWIVKGMLYWDD